MPNLRLLKTKKINYKEIYLRLFENEIGEYIKDTENRQALKRISYYGVKFSNVIYKEHEEWNYEQLEEFLNVTEVVKVAISLLTPNELITVFPVDKSYDGNKYEIKDYFFTINELSKIGMNNMIMAKVEELLWDYENTDVRMFLVNSLCATSDLYKTETGEGIMEKWAKENNIPTYEIYTHTITNKQYLYNYQTGENTEIKKQAPKYLKLLK